MSLRARPTTRHNLKRTQRSAAPWGREPGLQARGDPGGYGGLEGTPRWKGVGTLFVRKTAARKPLENRWGTALEGALEAGSLILELPNRSEHHSIVH